MPSALSKARFAWHPVGWSHDRRSRSLPSPSRATMQAPSDATGFSIAARSPHATGSSSRSASSLPATWSFSSRAYKTLAISVVSFIANFFDTLGIGSFATTTSMVRQFKMIPDEHIPGTLNVGYVIPTVVQAYIYTQARPGRPQDAHRADRRRGPRRMARRGRRVVVAASEDPDRHGPRAARLRDHHVPDAAADSADARRRRRARADGRQARHRHRSATSFSARS